MPLWLIIGIGSFIGGILRFLVSGWIQSGAITFPLGTLGVNFLGSFILSLVMYLSEYAGLFSEEAHVPTVIANKRSPLAKHYPTIVLQAALEKLRNILESPNS